MTKARLLTASMVVLGSWACSSPKLHEPNRAALEGALSNLEGGRHEEAEDQLYGMLAASQVEKQTYELQRLAAYYLLSRLHLAASEHGPYLTEPNQRGGQSDSPTPHLVRSLFWSATGLDALAKTDFGRAETDLPEALVSLDDQAVDVGLLLNMIVVNVRLGFEQRSAELVGDLVRDHARIISDYTKCQEELLIAGISSPLDSWIYLALHQHYSDLSGVDSQEQAYRYGILAREAFQQTGTSSGDEAGTKIVEWVQDNKQWSFVCKDGDEFDPDRNYCRDCGDKNVEFRAVRR